MDPKTPSRQRKEEVESNTPSTETTKQLPLPCRRQLAELEEKCSSSEEEEEHDSNDVTFHTHSGEEEDEDSN
jgi:hypothetical protein